MSSSRVEFREQSGIDTPGWNLCKNCQHYDFFYDPEADPSAPKAHICYHPSVWQPRPDQVVTGAHIATRCVDGRAGKCGIHGVFFEPKRVALEEESKNTKSIPEIEPETKKKSWRPRWFV